MICSFCNISEITCNISMKLFTWLLTSGYYLSGLVFQLSTRSLWVVRQESAITLFQKDVRYATSINVVVFENWIQFINKNYFLRFRLDLNIPKSRSISISCNCRTSANVILPKNDASQEDSPTVLFVSKLYLCTLKTR